MVVDLALAIFDVLQKDTDASVKIQHIHSMKCVLNKAGTRHLAYRHHCGNCGLGRMTEYTQR